MHGFLFPNVPFVIIRTGTFSVHCPRRARAVAVSPNLLLIIKYKYTKTSSTYKYLLLQYCIIFAVVLFSAIDCNPRSFVFQSKHQKHQAFEAELAANADRLGAVCGMGQS